MASPKPNHAQRSPTRSPRWRSAAGRSPASRAFSTISPAPTPTLPCRAIERDMSPKLSEHSSSISLEPRPLPARRRSSRAARQNRLDAEQRRVLERTMPASCAPAPGSMPRAGSAWPPSTSGLPTLGTQFGQNMPRRRAGLQLVLDGEPISRDCRISSARQRRAPADDLGHPGKHVVTLSRSSIEPFLQFSARRDLREKAFDAWIRRGENGDKNDNRKIAEEIIALRAERAALLGYRTFAEFRLDDTMAKTPATFAICSSRFGRRPWPQRRARSAVAPGWSTPRAELQARSLGLALLRRESARGRLRSR